MARFEKGVSGNPSGRPKKSEEQIEFEKNCQLALKEHGWDFLKNCLLSGGKQEKRWALETMLDRGFLKMPVLLDADIANAPGDSGISVSDIAGAIAVAIGKPAEGSLKADSKDSMDGGK